MTAEIQLEIDGAVGIITIVNRDVRNALNADLASQLSEVCATVNADKSVGAVVLRGADGMFCSGYDTRGWDPSLSQVGAESDRRSRAVDSAVWDFGNLAVPTVAAVRGAAVGAGLNLLLAADMRVVADDARVFAGFLKIGLHPGVGLFTLLGRLGGRETTAAVVLSGEEMSGRDLHRLGMAWKAPSDAEVESVARGLAGAAGRDPELVRRAVRSLRRELGPPGIPWEAAIELNRANLTWSQHRRLHPDETA